MYFVWVINVRNSRRSVFCIVRVLCRRGQTVPNYLKLLVKKRSWLWRCSSNFEDMSKLDQNTLNAGGCAVSHSAYRGSPLNILWNLTTVTLCWGGRALFQGFAGPASQTRPVLKKMAKNEIKFITRLEASNPPFLFPNFIAIRLNPMVLFWYLRCSYSRYTCSSNSIIARLTVQNRPAYRKGGDVYELQGP